jgi:hypothetical protein
LFFIRSFLIQKTEIKSVKKANKIQTKIILLLLIIFFQTGRHKLNFWAFFSHKKNNKLFFLLCKPFPILAQNYCTTKIHKRKSANLHGLQQQQQQEASTSSILIEAQRTKAAVKNAHFMIRVGDASCNQLIVLCEKKTRV